MPKGSISDSSGETAARRPRSGAARDDAADRGRGARSAGDPRSRPAWTPAAHRSVSDDKELYNCLICRGNGRFTRRSIRGGGRPRKYLARALPADRRRRARAGCGRSLLLALCRGAELLSLDSPRQARPGGDRGGPAGHRRTSRGRAEGLLLAQIAEVDQIADHRDRRRGRDRRGRSTRCERYRVQLVFDGEAPRRASRAGRRAHPAQRTRADWCPSAGSAAVIEEARRLQPVSVDVTLVTLRIFPETVTAEENRMLWYSVARTFTVPHRSGAVDVLRRGRLHLPSVLSSRGMPDVDAKGFSGGSQEAVCCQRLPRHVVAKHART